ncbi:winged helix-turn-helix transcriptional regulator [Algoriphagus resistens]|uniref:winged helix-turn-helix transcriptional regulator n=1 Tax=Algoriphagus resistens TaxID=1750590 RepID=UPI000716A12A|nr:helix-turn-helix domain-containing protein [Algoriphagus resistens]
MIEERKITSTNYLNQTYLEEKCTLNELINILSKRWTTDVLFEIEEGNDRFSSLKKSIDLISDNVLANRLKLLEQYKLIKKTKDDSGTTGKYQYFLTPIGYKLSELLDQLCQFSDSHMNSNFT